MFNETARIGSLLEVIDGNGISDESRSETRKQEKELSMMTKSQKRSCLLIMLIMAFSVFSAACIPQSTASENQGTITVIGQGEAHGRPDQAQAEIGVETFAKTVARAIRENETITQRVLEALETAGIAAEDIQTANYSLWAEQEYDESGPAGVAGYWVTNQLSLTVHDLDQLGTILAEATDAGANRVYNVSFNVEDPKALEEEARSEAMQNAREKAEELAELSGLEVSGIQSISEVIGYSVLPKARDGGMGAGAAEALAPSFYPGQLSYPVQIQVTFTVE